MRPQEASEEAEETMAGVSEIIAIAMCVCSLPFPFPAATGQALDWGGVEREAGQRQKLYVSLTESPGLVFPEGVREEGWRRHSSIGRQWLGTVPVCGTGKPLTRCQALCTGTKGGTF